MKEYVSCLMLISFSLLFSCEHRVYQNRGMLSAYDTLKEGFENPPAQARPKVYWWWLNGNVDTVRLREELYAMKRAGIGGADIFEIGVPRGDSMIPAGPAFMSTESLRSIGFAITEAAKLNMEVGLNVSSSWNAGGSWTLPKYAAKALYVSKVKVTGGAVTQRINLPFPKIEKFDNNGKSLILYGANGKPAYYEDVAILALPASYKKEAMDTSRILNLSNFFDADKELLDWKAPSGEWEVYRYVCANSGEQLKLPSPNSHGPIIDHFDSAATRAHFTYIINHLKPVISSSNKSTLKSLYLASYEATGLVWTSTLPETFKNINGYDIYKFIPALFDKELFGQQVTERFHSDFKKTLSELMINNLYKKAKEITNAYGLKINSEAGGPGEPLHNVPVEPLKALGALDIPRGEFWNKHYYYNKDSIDILRVVKEVSAAAHIYNRRIVEEESFTSFQHWQEGPFDLKPLADRAFCEGMNKVVIHGFSHNPTGTGFPGIVYHAGTHFNDKRVWWPKIKPFTDYLARVSYILQKTDFVADVLYYYGDKIPNYVAPKNTRFTVGPGYDYEVINSEVLLNQLTVKEGQLVLPSGSRFKLLALGNMETASPDVLIKLKELAQKGAIITGSKPKGATGLYHAAKEDKLIGDLSEQLWIKAGSLLQKEKLRQGKIFSDISPLTILQHLRTSPDFEYADSGAAIFDYIHTHRNDLDFYLIRNTTNLWLSRFCLFRQSGKTPEIWEPLSGNIIPISVYKQDGQQVKIPLTLPPYGSLFIVFRKQPDAFHYNDIQSSEVNPPLIQYTSFGLQFLKSGNFKLVSAAGIKQIQNEVKLINIEGPWEVIFPKGWGAPEKATFPKLISWSKSEYSGIKYFSGVATYRKTFSFSEKEAALKEGRIYLDLGDISKVADVWLNDRPLEITWAKPYRFDITDIIKSGENTLKVEVANTWSNRLTGDAITGEKYTKTNITVSSDRVLWAQTPLLESGLIGPVTLRLMKLVH